MLSHTGGTGYTMQMLEARARGGRRDRAHLRHRQRRRARDGRAEASYAYTVSHTGALLRLAQIATALGAQLGPLDAIPDAVAPSLDAPAADRRRPTGSSS